MKRLKFIKKSIEEGSFYLLVLLFCLVLVSILWIVITIIMRKYFLFLLLAFPISLSMIMFGIYFKYYRGEEDN